MSARKTPKELALALYLAARRAKPGQTARTIRDFVERMVADGHADILPGVLALLHGVELDMDGADEVVVESAGPVTEVMMTRALEAAGVDRQRAVIVRRIVPELLGGLRIVTRDGVLDLSLRGQICGIGVGRARRR